MPSTDGDEGKRVGRMDSQMSPGVVESRRQNRTLRQKNLCDIARTACERAMKITENGRTNPSGGKWAPCITYYFDSGWGGNRARIGA